MFRSNECLRGLLITIFCIWIAECGTVYKTILQEGTGPTPQTNQTVVVHYVGTLPSGTKFDSSRDRNEPFKFKLGAGEVIQGWDAGVSSMKVGERAQLEIASEDAYGDAGMPPDIPPRATLHFDIELLAIEQQPGVQGQSPPQSTVTFSDFQSMTGGNQDFLSRSPGQQGFGSNGAQAIGGQTDQGLSSNMFPRIADQRSTNPNRVFSSMNNQPNQEATSQQIVDLNAQANREFERQMQSIRDSNQGLATQSQGQMNPNRAFQRNQNGGSANPNDSVNQGIRSQFSQPSRGLPGQASSGFSAQNVQGFGAQNNQRLGNAMSFPSQNQPGNPNRQTGVGSEPQFTSVFNDQMSQTGRQSSMNDRFTPQPLTNNFQGASMNSQVPTGFQPRFGVAPIQRSTGFGSRQSMMTGQPAGGSRFEGNGQVSFPQDGRTMMPNGPEFSTARERAQFIGGMSRMMGGRGGGFGARPEFVAQSRFGGIPPGMVPGMMDGRGRPDMRPRFARPMMSPFMRQMLRRRRLA